MTYTEAYQRYIAGSKLVKMTTKDETAKDWFGGIAMLFENGNKLITVSSLMLNTSTEYIYFGDNIVAQQTTDFSGNLPVSLNS